jgi:CheY-like chemotaxis protein
MGGARVGGPVKPVKSNILLVDDRKENLLALEVVLGSREYNLIQVRSGLEAIQCVKSNDIAVIVLDLQMPGMDGFETARKIKNLPRGKDIPLIFVTAIYNEDEDVKRGYASGALDFFSKPLDADLLRTKVQLYSDLHQKTELIKKYERLLRDQIPQSKGSEPS